jgi:integrase
VTAFLPVARSRRGSITPSLEAASLAAVKGSAIYERSAREYFAFASARGLSAGEPDTVRAWLEDLKGRYAGSSLIPFLAGVKKALRGAALKLATAQEAAAFSEALRTIKSPKKATKAVRRAFILSPAEETAVLEAMTPRDAALFRFLMGTGARISEALGIRLEQCKAEGEMVLCPVLGKGGKTRELRVSRELFELVREAFDGRIWFFESSGGKPLYRDYAFRRITKAVLRTTGKNFSPHCARHTFATRALERTGKIKAVSEYLGHASAAITLDMYTHEQLTDEELARM